MSASALPDPVRVYFECGHTADIAQEEYGDGSAWCPICDGFVIYDRCQTCGSLDCQSKNGPTLPHDGVAA